MDYLELKKLEEQEINREYDLFLSSGLSEKEYFDKRDKRKLAIQLKEKARIKEKLKKELEKFKNKPIKKLSSKHFYGKKYESDELEQEYGEEQYKRERENLMD